MSKEEPGGAVMERERGSEREREGERSEVRKAGCAGGTGKESGSSREGRQVLRQSDRQTASQGVRNDGKNKKRKRKKIDK